MTKIRKGVGEESNKRIQSTDTINSSTPTYKDIPICGYATLIATVLGRDKGEIARRLGLPDTRPKCLRCGKVLVGQQRKFCSKICFDLWRRPLVECDECGRLFRRRKSELVFWIGKRGKQRLFCSRRCLGRYVGKHYGFAIHPENTGMRKYNYDEVWAWHCLTGWGALRLSRALGIPQSSIDVILCTMRKRLKEGENGGEQGTS